MQVNKIDSPCVIYREDAKMFMKWGDDVIIFDDSKQAAAFSEKFWMFFQTEQPYYNEHGQPDTPFMIVGKPADMENGDGIVLYSSISHLMDQELEY